MEGKNWNIIAGALAESSLEKSGLDGATILEKLLAIFTKEMDDSNQSLDYVKPIAEDMSAALETVTKDSPQQLKDACLTICALCRCCPLPGESTLEAPLHTFQIMEGEPIFRVLEGSIPFLDIIMKETVKTNEFMMNNRDARLLQVECEQFLADFPEKPSMAAFLNDNVDNEQLSVDHGEDLLKLCDLLQQKSDQLRASLGEEGLAKPDALALKKFAELGAKCFNTLVLRFVKALESSTGLFLDEQSIDQNSFSWKCITNESMGFLFKLVDLFADGPVNALVQSIPDTNPFYAELRDAKSKCKAMISYVPGL